MGLRGKHETGHRSNTLCIWLESEPTKLHYDPKQNQEGRGVRHLPLFKSLYWSIFKKSRHLGFGVYRYLGLPQPSSLNCNSLWTDIQIP
jgi:hypothetical protein